jgi:hypothetical protein
MKANEVKSNGAYFTLPVIIIQLQIAGADPDRMLRA